MDKQKPLEEIVEEMRAVAAQLVNLTFPKAPPKEEKDIDCLKQRRVVVDGYDLVLHLSRADYKDCFVESLELCSAIAPFLPMYLVCKVGAIFLGGHELKYAETFKNGRKVYVWTVALDERGRPIALDTRRVQEGHYEDFQFAYVAKELL